MLSCSGVRSFPLLLPLRNFLSEKTRVCVRTLELDVVVVCAVHAASCCFAGTATSPDRGSGREGASTSRHTYIHSMYTYTPWRRMGGSSCYADAREGGYPVVHHAFSAADTFGFFSSIPRSYFPAVAMARTLSRTHPASGTPFLPPANYVAPSLLCTLPSSLISFCSVITPLL